MDIILLSCTLGLTFATSLLRIESTLIGYQIGDFKHQESLLLDETSRLKMKLAKLTSKGNLTILASKGIVHSDSFEALAAVENTGKQKEAGILHPTEPKQ